MAENYDFTNLVTPINISIFESLLRSTDYCADETEFICGGLRDGFSIGYQGPENRRLFSNNHRLKIGMDLDLWNKIMGEVEEKKFIGPLTEQEIPWEFFIQSPLSLVSKKGSSTEDLGKVSRGKNRGKMIRLVFDLSYPKGDSVNYHTPEHL